MNLAIIIVTVLISLWAFYNRELFDRFKFNAYAISGVFVGLAGILYMSRNNAGLPNAGAGLEFEAMTAAIIGGTSFSGGVGTAMGTLAGSFIMGFLNNGMNLLGVQAYSQQVVRGVIIVLAVIWDIHSKQRRSSTAKAKN